MSNCQREINDATILASCPDLTADFLLITPSATDFLKVPYSVLKNCFAGGSILHLTNADFADATNYTNAAFNNVVYELYWNDIQRYLIGNEWSYKTGGGFTINIPGFNALQNHYDIFLTVRGTLSIPAQFTIQYNDILGKPAVFTGDWNTLSNKPTIPAAQIQSDWNQANSLLLDYVKNKPALKPVATSGLYSDLTSKPVLAPVATSGLYTDLTSLPTIPAAQIQSDWNQTNAGLKDFIKNKPTFNPQVAGNLADGATISAIDCTTANEFRVTLTGNNHVVPNPTGAVDTQEITLTFKQGGAGNNQVVYSSKFIFGIQPTNTGLSSAVGAFDMIRFKYNSSDDKFYCISQALGFNQP